MTALMASAASNVLSIVVLAERTSPPAYVLTMAYPKLANASGVAAIVAPQSKPPLPVKPAAAASAIIWS